MEVLLSTIAGIGVNEPVNKRSHSTPEGTARPGTTWGAGRGGRDGSEVTRPLSLLMHRPPEWPINSNYGKEATITRLRGSILNPRTLYSRASLSFSLSLFRSLPSRPTYLPIYLSPPRSRYHHRPIPSFSLPRRSPSDPAIPTGGRNLLPSSPRPRARFTMFHRAAGNTATGDTRCFSCRRRRPRYFMAARSAALIRIPKVGFIAGAKRFSPSALASSSAALISDRPMEETFVAWPFA